jgi:hypothetical protein
MAVRSTPSWTLAAVTAADDDRPDHKVTIYGRSAGCSLTFGTGLERRLTSADVDHLDRRRLPPHVVRLVRACWQLGAYPQLGVLRLRRWAHMLGYRGHWTTRSRRYSTTFRMLRTERQHFARRHTTNPLGFDDDEDRAVIVLGSWTYAGRGYHHQSERWLAPAAAARLAG